MRIPNQASAAGAWLLENGHRALLTITRGRFPRTVLGMEPLELHTTGRRSGERRTTLITTPIRDEDRVVLIASKGGHDQHPAWYLNLTANPDVTITIRGQELPYRARTATGAEREELWQQAVDVYGGYTGYQRNTEREIPVVVCERQP